MKTRRILILLCLMIVLLVLILYGCTQKDSVSIPASMSDNVSSAADSIGGAMDDFSGESVAFNDIKDSTSIWKDFVIPAAIAGECTRAFNSCDSGVRTRTADCAIGAYSWSGGVTMTFYSSAATQKATCNISTDGDYFVRTVNFTRSGPRGSIQTISTAHSDYRGNTIEGGTKVTRTGTQSFNLEIIGVSKKLDTAAGAHVFDISLRTLSPMSVSGEDRANRLVDGGSLEVIHNLAQYVATHTPSNIQWSSTCCYPVSGKDIVIFEGSEEGSAEVSFTGCGTATVTMADKSEDITLDNCE